MGSLVLSPAFTPTTYDYTTNSTNASDTLSYTAADTGAEVTVELNDTEVSTDTISWTSSTDTLVLTVEAGDLSQVYTITCTHTP